MKRLKRRACAGLQDLTDKVKGYVLKPVKYQEPATAETDYKTVALPLSYLGNYIAILETFGGIWEFPG